MTEVRARHKARISASFHSPLASCTWLKETLLKLREISQAQMEGEVAGLTFKSTSRTGELPGEGWTWWVLLSKSRAPVLGERKGSAIPCWTRLQIPLPYLKFLFIQESLAFKWALGRELLQTPAPGRSGPGWSRGGKGVPVIPQLEWVTHGTGQDKAWDPLCAHSARVPAGHWRVPGQC